MGVQDGEEPSQQGVCFHTDSPSWGQNHPERDRETETERQRERQRQRDTDRETERNETNPLPSPAPGQGSSHLSTLSYQGLGLHHPAPH